MVVEGKRVAIFGSTGSIGRQALQVAKSLGLSVVGLAAGSNSVLLQEQVWQYHPEWAVLVQGESFACPSTTHLAIGREALLHFAGQHEADVVVAAIAGLAGLEPTWHAVQSGVAVALANKESLVAAGELLMQTAAASGAQILPIDSEHSAIWQCLQGTRREQVQKLIITASGGPFREWPRERLATATLADALAHPTWNMGYKNTIDSATLMNKGLEVIEAHWLFGMDYDHMQAVVHPESIVHSLVELVDGSLLAQLAPPDMRLPIQLALTYPERLPNPWPRLSWEQAMQLRFEPPRWSDFPCLRLAIEAGQAGGSYPIVLNAANEIAVQAFAEGNLGFTAIPELIAAVLECHVLQKPSSLEEIIHIDSHARDSASNLLVKMQL